jgi:hypothetical protein
MRAAAIAAFILILLLGVAPAAAAGDERYGYIKVQDVTVRLYNDTAVINVHYTVDEGTRIIFFLLGKQDLKNKLAHILNYESARMRRIDLSSAEFIVDDASYSYGKGIYWYPSHSFNVVIPSLTVHSPQITRTFSNTDVFPDGIGYFDTR